MLPVQLIYVSTLKPGVDPSELARIYESAVKNNPPNQITGMMLFGNDYFLQCLEGSRSVVNELYSRIVQDPRHTNITLLQYGEITRRNFDEWGMKLTLMSAKDQRVILRHSGSGDFNPYTMTGASSLELMCEMAA